MMTTTNTAETLSPEYAQALETVSVAQRAYDKACVAYRARLIGDAEFLAARALMKDAEAAFDIAFEAAAARAR